jgi:hypothetical protein
LTELFAEQIEDTLSNIYTSLGNGETLQEAVEEETGFEDYVAAYSELEVALIELYDAI